MLTPGAHSCNGTKSSPNLHHRRPVTAQVTQTSRTEPLMKRITSTRNICKRYNRNPDNPTSPPSPENIRRIRDVGMEEHTLSNIPPWWMVSEIVKSKYHIRFDETALDLWNIPIAAIERVPMIHGVSDSTWRVRAWLGGKDTPDKYHAPLDREANASTSTSTGIPGHKGRGALSPLPPIAESPDGWTRCRR